MAYTPKTFTQILNTLMTMFVGQTPSITDFNVGSVMRSLMEAVAGEMERMYMQILETTADSIDSSAYLSFGFQLLPAVAAYGQLTLTRTGGYVPDIAIASGTPFRVPNTNKVYATTASSLWTGGSSSTTFTVSVTCGTTGSFGNTPSGSITELVTPITGIASMTNPLSFITGIDDETSDERRQRFGSYIASLSRATASAVEFGGLTTKIIDGNGYTTERVVKAHAFQVNTTSATAVTAGAGIVITPADMSGIVSGSNLVVDSGSSQEVVSVTAISSTTFTATFVKNHSGTWTVKAIGEAMLMVHNGVGTTGGQVTSAALVTAAQGVIDGTTTAPGYKAAGVVVRVVGATEDDRTVRVVITDLFPGYTLTMVRGNALGALALLIQNLDIGESLRLADITQAVRNVPGIRDCQVVLPATNITATNVKLIVSSSITASQFTLSTGLDVNIV